MDKISDANSVSRKILDDAPVEADAFSGGGHARTAQALARAIRKSGNCDQAIGLEGSWGAGKSTIVRLARQKLSEGSDDRSYHVFTYDLWTNQTGHFKRSFLEAFLNWSLTEFPAKKAKIERRQAQIANKVKTVDTDLFRRFSWFGVATVAFLYFTPVLYGWLSPAGFKGDDGNAAVTVGAALAWAALAAYTMMLLIAVVRAFPKGSDFLPGVKDAVSRSLSIFSKEAERTTVTQNIRDEDPTQYEFHSIFRGIVAEICAKNDRIVVVFDNIDRLPQARIPDAWAEVRAAFYGEVNGHTERATITAIVPYARPIALDAFRKSTEAKPTSDGETARDVGNGDTSPARKIESENDYLRADVFRKSFDAIFVVSPPVLSDASNFFLAKFREATGGTIGDDVVRRAYRIFDLHVQNASPTVTPRQVIAFINDVTNWWEQWDGQIPLETIAVFVAHQDRLLSNPLALRQKSTINSRMIQHAQQPDIRRHLAALSFNVEPNLAFQILLHDGLRRALVASEPSELQSLADSAEANGFRDIFPQVIDDHVTAIATTSGEYQNAIANLAVLNADPTDISYAKNEFVDALDRFRETSLARWADEEKLFAIVGLVDKSALPPLVRRVAGKIQDSFPQGPAKADFEQGRSWIKIIDKFLGKVAETHGPEARVEAARVIAPPQSPEAIIGIAYDCDVTSCHLKDLGRVAITTAVFEALAEHAKGTEVFGYAWPELEYLAAVKQKKSLRNTAASKMMAETVAFGTDELDWLAQTITLVTASLARTDGEKEIVAPMMYESGALSHYAFGQSEHRGNPDNAVTAAAVWLAMLAHAHALPDIVDVNNRPIFGDVEDADEWFRALFASEDVDPGLAGRIAAYAIDHRRTGYCFEQACTEEGWFIFCAVSSKICESEFFTIPPRAPVLTKVFSDLRDIVSDEQFEKLAALVGKAADSAYWEEIALSTVGPKMVEFALGREEPGWKFFLRKFDELLRAANAQEWRSALAGKGNLVALHDARSRGTPIELSPSELYEPLAENLLAVLSGKYDPAARNYETLLQSLPKQSQLQIGKDIFDRHDLPTLGIAKALGAFGELLGTLPFDKSPDRTVEHYLLPLIKQGAPASDSFIANHGKIFAQALKKASEANRLLVLEFLPAPIPRDEEAEDAAPDERVIALRGHLGL